MTNCCKDNKMSNGVKKNNAVILAVIGVVALVGMLFYYGGGNKSSAPPNTAPNTAIDSSHSAMHSATDPTHSAMHSATANVSSASLNNLIDKPAPAFSLTDSDDKIYSSDNLRGKNVVLFFNEGLMCYPGCWKQIVAFSKDDRFKSDDVAVLSVVVDSKNDWQQAINKMPDLAQATVVFDNGAAVSKTFGVLSLPSSMHPGSLPGHTYVVIDKEGVVRYVFDDPNMGIRNDQIIEELKKLN